MQNLGCSAAVSDVCIQHSLPPSVVHFDYYTAKSRCQRSSLFFLILSSLANSHLQTPHVFSKNVAKLQARALPILKRQRSYATKDGTAMRSMPTELWYCSGYRYKSQDLPRNLCANMLGHVMYWAVWLQLPKKSFLSTHRQTAHVARQNRLMHQGRRHTLRRLSQPQFSRTGTGALAKNGLLTFFFCVLALI